MVDEILRWKTIHFACIAVLLFAMFSVKFLGETLFVSFYSPVAFVWMLYSLYMWNKLTN